MTPEPRLFLGHVMHRRLRPAVNAFVYPVFYVQLPLRRLEAARGSLFSLDRFNLLSFHRRDHGERDGSPLVPWIEAKLRERGLPHDGEIVLQTFPRVLGYVFNPVSFWFCHDRDGALRVVLAEVSNTFGERHNYLVHHPDLAPIQPRDELTARKLFHVSPFFPLRGEYRFRFDTRGPAHVVHIDLWDDGQRQLGTCLAGRAQALDGRAMGKWLLRHPFLTLGVIARIHWQALRLAAKRVSFHRKPAPPLEETT